MNFADRLILRARRLEHPLCLGLDPHLELLPALFREGSMSALSMSARDPRTHRAVETLLRTVIERAAARIVVIKPQIAFFERLGPPGLEILARLLDLARALDLPVLLDAKRGDIGSTAAAYAEAFFGPEAAWPADALTVNPYLGLDSLRPFVEKAGTHDGGIFVLVKTSNPGARDIQDLEIDGEPLFVRVARLLGPDALTLRGETGWSALGVVVGATQPEDAPRVRACLPHSLFLVPGYGAQGGSALAAVRGFMRGPHGRLEGGVISSSRALVFPAAAAMATSARAWEQALDEALERAIGELQAAIA